MFFRRQTGDLAKTAAEGAGVFIADLPGDLEFQGRQIAAEDAHAAFMSALGFAYAQIVSAEAYLSEA